MTCDDGHYALCAGGCDGGHEEAGGRMGLRSIPVERIVSPRCQVLVVVIVGGIPFDGSSIGDLGHVTRAFVSLYPGLRNS